MSIGSLQTSRNLSHHLDCYTTAPPWKSVANIITVTDCFGEIALIHQRAETLRNLRKASIAPFNDMPRAETVEKTSSLAHRFIGMKPATPVPIVCISKQSSRTLNLENRFKSECLDSVDIHAKIDFADFLSPNEWAVSGIKPHLDQAFNKVEEPSYLMSTGTERCLFDLVLANNCKGLIMRDINPRAKAYSDFNILMLRIVKNRNEYLELSSWGEPALIAEKKKKIRAMLEVDGKMPLEVKSYYQKHFDDFAEIYFDQIFWRVERPWFKDRRFKEVEYYNDDALFAKIQRYARSGNIIATVGDIGNLDPFREIPLAAIDISNIPNYALLNFKWPRDVQIIWTIPPFNQTQYLSKKFHPISDEQRIEIGNLLESLSDSGDIALDSLNHRDLPERLGLDSPPFWCHELLIALRKYREKNCLYSEGLGWLSRKTIRSEKISRSSIQNLEKLSSHPEIGKLVAGFAGNWGLIDGQRFMAMSGAPRWLCEFRVEVLTASDNPNFLQWLEQNDTHIRAKIADFPTDLTTQTLEHWAFESRENHSPQTAHES